jgi:ParB/RepB/Spo0J family partition protein
LILTPEALQAAPLLSLIGTGAHATGASLAAALNRDHANLSKSLKACDAKGWTSRDGKTPILTDLGRGVLAAIDRANNPDAGAGAVGVSPEGEGLREIALDLIDDDPELNPRKKKLGEDAAAKDAEKLEELTASIRSNGVLQPVLVRQGLTDGRFRIVAGSRRKRAAFEAGLTSIPALFRIMTDAQAHEAATIENVQRDDMTPMEEARAFTRIVADRMAADPDLQLKDAKEIVASRLDKTVRYVELRMELLKLPAPKQDEVELGTLSVTDAREWLRKRPKPLKLTSRQWLIALELFDAQERSPVTEGTGFNGPAATVREVADQDRDLEILSQLPAGLVSEVRQVEDADGWPTGRACVRFFEHRLDALRLKFGGIDHDETRAEALAEAREAVFGNPVEIAEGYATEWLNGPFDPAPEILAEIAQAKAEAKTKADARAREEAQQQVEADEAMAAALSRLTSALQLAERLDAKPPKAIDPLFGVVFAASGKPLPLYPTRLAGIIAANGARVMHDFPEHAPPHPDTVARVTLLAVALNTAAGLATPQAPPATDESPPELADLDVGEVGDGDEGPAPDHEDDGGSENAGGLAPWERRLIGAPASASHT